MAKYENMNLVEFINKCGTEEQCRERFFKLRWPEGMYAKIVEAQNVKKSLTEMSTIAQIAELNFL